VTELEALCEEADLERSPAVPAPGVRHTAPVPTVSTALVIGAVREAEGEGQLKKLVADMAS
jgi:hypothetical protein